MSQQSVPKTPHNQPPKSESSCTQYDESNFYVPDSQIKEHLTGAVSTSHISGGHTFVVTTVTTERMIETTQNTSVDRTTAPFAYEESRTSTNDVSQKPLTSKAVVPISSSLPSKLLRFHAKRSAQALLKQVEQSQSVDSQFGSEEGAVGGSGHETNDCADIFDSLPIPLTSAQSPPTPATTPVQCLEDKLIDVGMGSSIEDSEESEEDDELKPLAIDNHVLHDININSKTERDLSPEEAFSPSAVVLSEANLEKFHKHQPHGAYYYQMDNIYLHPNFKLETDNSDKDIPECSPPPAVAPANSPTETKRVHRSFLTMKKSSAVAPEAVKAISVALQTEAASTERSDQTTDQSNINEIDTLDPALIPSDDLANEITDAVEYYFSDDSILKDAFLLKHVRRNKEGFVSLKLVSSFKRVRQLTKDWKVVGNAIRRKSRQVELNDIGTKVRRLEPLPNFDETMPSRTIVVCDLPLDKLTIEKVSDLFSKCGEIALIRILKPGMAIPVDVRQFMNKYPEMQQKECALVEYVESSSAREAKNLRGPFEVYEMVAPKKKTGKKAVIQVAAPVARMVENYRYYNDASYERTRGGSFSGIMPHENGDLRYRMKRFNSDIHTKVSPEVQYSHGPPYHYQHHNNATQHRGSFGSEHRGSFGSEHTHQFQPYQARGSISSETSNNGPAPSASVSISANNNHSSAFYAYSPRRYSNNSTISAHSAAAVAVADAAVNTSPINNNNNTNNNSNTSNNLVRRLSNCSDSYSNYSESRRPSTCSESMSQRRDSNCSENCPCSRRISDFGQNEVYRKISQSSIGSSGVGERRFSNGSMQFERTFSNPNELSHSNSSNSFPRRMSNDFNYDRKQSVDTQTEPLYDDPNVGGGGGGYNVFPRRYSNNFNVSQKMAAYDNAQYINGRRISTDSGYDRRYSFGSEYEGSPRSRTSSFLNNYKHGADFDGQPRSRTGSFLDGSPRSRSGSFAQRNAENLVRTPMGPDGSRGFSVRARKFGNTVSPVN